MKERILGPSPPLSNNAKNAASLKCLAARFITTRTASRSQTDMATKARSKNWSRNGCFPICTTTSAFANNDMKLAVNSEEALSDDEQEHGVLVLAGVNACYLAFGSGRAPRTCPEGLEDLLSATSFSDVLKEIAGCTRMSAGVTFHAMGAWASIRFCNGSTLLKSLTIAFDINLQKFLIVAK